MNSYFSSYHPVEIDPFLHITLVQFILFFISHWCNSSFSLYHTGAIHPVLHITLVQFILFFISHWCDLFCSSYHTGAIYPVLHINTVHTDRATSPGLGIRSFAHRSFANSLIRSFRSNQMSDCERFAQDK